MRINKLIFFLIFFFTLTSFAQGSQLGLTDPNKPILVSHTARQFTINLSSNPTTGFSWRLKSYDAAILIPISQSFKASRSVPGAGGIESFVFEVDSKAFRVKRVTEITFIYLRPWNMEVAKTVSFNVVFQ